MSSSGVSRIVRIYIADTNLLGFEALSMLLFFEMSVTQIDLDRCRRFIKPTIEC